MRAVALSDATVQANVAKSFVPLKITIPHGAERFPVDWPALKHWSDTYQRMGGKKCEGLTGCTVISPDLQAEYANTGSAFVWEMFDSIAYDAKKFNAMLGRGLARYQREKEILAEPGVSERERRANLNRHRNKARREMATEGRFRLPPKGFTIKGAVELFQLSGDVPPQKK